jgi:hypothetical protein
MKKVIRLTESELISLIKRVISESDPKVGTGKKPEGSDRRLYTDENPSDTVSVKFRTKQDIVDTLNKESFKSKSHARQSQIINLIHQRLRVALERAKDPEVKKRLRTAFEYIETKKEQSKNKTQEMKEGLHDTSWENEEGDKITLMDLLNATEDIPVEKISVEKLKPYLLTWDGDEDEVKKIDNADLQYPILIFVDNGGEFISIIDGHHRAQKAVRKGLETIKAKVIPINSLPKDIRKVFGHFGKQEQSESKQTNRKDLDFFDLVDKGIIFITEPFGNGKKQKSNWEGDSNIITLWNLKHPEKGQEWVFDAIKYLKPEAIQWWNDEGQFTLKDEKYNQILRSIKMYDNSSKQEQNKSELTERCWKGYTQKGMKTMFGKRYPNCVKKKKG